MAPLEKNSVIKNPLPMDVYGQRPEFYEFAVGWLTNGNYPTLNIEKYLNKWKISQKNLQNSSSTVCSARNLKEK